ncbi:MAG: hypothetical protein WB769_09290, partial [Pseudolabrys sp.]
MSAFDCGDLSGRVGRCQARPDFCGTRGRWFKSTRLYHLRKVHRKENAGVMRRRFLFERSSPI